MVKKGLISISRTIVELVAVGFFLLGFSNANATVIAASESGQCSSAVSSACVAQEACIISFRILSF